MASVLKKTLRASEQLRPDLEKARRDLGEVRQPDMANMLEMLVFIDEIEPLKAPLVRAQWRGLKTNLVKTTGWAPRGARLGSGRCAAGPRAPFGHWQTQTFIAGPGCDGLLAP